MNLSLFSLIDWGSAPEWVAAVGTVGAVIVSLVLASKGGRETRLRDRRRQAESISMWRSINAAGKTRAIVINNTSSGTIFDIALSIAVSYGGGPAFQIGNDQQVFLMGIPPGKFEVPAPKEPVKEMHKQLGISMTFRDKHGVYWRRDATGALSETKTQEPYSDLDVSLPITTFRSFITL